MKIRITYWACQKKKHYSPSDLSFLKRFHGQEELKEGGRYKVSLSLDQTLYHMARLEISSVISSDQGEYRARARNQHGEGVATINLNFESGSKK